MSKDVKRIHLDFAYAIEDGHFGARKVWRKYLPRLKYHNPAISMTVHRRQDQTGPATLTVSFAPLPNSDIPASDTSMTPSKHLPTDRAEIIDMKHKHESEILKNLMTLTNGQQYEASPDELAELEDVDEARKRGDRDRQAQKNLNERRKQEQSLLDQARGSV